MIDLVDQKALVWDSDDKDAAVGRVGRRSTEDLADQAEDHRAKQTARSCDDYREVPPRSSSTPLSSMDDEAMEKYLETGEPPTADVLRTLHPQGHRHRRLQPRLCGRSYKNKGVQQCWTPSSTTCPPRPTSRPSRPWTRTVTRSASASCSDEEPFSALAFKVINDAVRRADLRARLFRRARRRARR